MIWNSAITRLRQHPLWVTCLASLILSAISIGTVGILNRDGMLYVSIARGVLGAEGLQALHSFDWPFFPLLIAGVSWVSHIEAETVGYLLCALLITGACVSTVAVSRRLFPGTEWAAVLVVLALPAFNQFRDEVIRDPGMWCFCMLAILFALRWQAQRQWHDCLFAQISLLLATLFRLEATALFPAFMLWQMFGTQPLTSNSKRAMQIAALPLIAGGIALLLVASGSISLPSRLMSYLSAANFAKKLDDFQQLAEVFQQQILKTDYAKEEASSMLFWGVMSAIPDKFFRMCSLFMLAFAFLASDLRATIRQWSIAGWCFVLYCIVLGTFLLNQFFLAGRYVGLLHFLATPVIALGVVTMWNKWRRLRWVFIAATLALGLSNVIHMSANKNAYIKDAGLWLKNNGYAERNGYIQDGRIAYYAGRYPLTPSPESLPEDGIIHGKPISYAVLRLLTVPLTTPLVITGKASSVIQAFPVSENSSIVIVE